MAKPKFPVTLHKGGQSIKIDSAFEYENLKLQGWSESKQDSKPAPKTASK